MTVQELQDQIQKLDDDDFQQLLAWIVTPERTRREAQPAVEQAQADLVTELQEAGKLEKPEAVTEEQAKENATLVPEWRDPGTDHSKMYHQGDVVRHKGKLVRSTHKGLNHWVPGVLNYDGRIWEIIGEEQPETPAEDAVESPTAPESAPEWKPNISVKPGEHYTFQGETYEVIQAHTTQADWLPDALPALYKKL